MTRILLTSTALALTSTAAFAGPIVVPAPPPPVIVPVEEPFEGFYVGIEGGFVFGDAEETNIPGAVNAPYSFDSGTAYGAFAGYNWQNGSTVFGGEIRALHFSDYTGPDNFEVLAVIDLRARVGIAMGDALIYGAAGYSIGSVDIGPEIDVEGFNVGGGVEYNITDTFFVRGDFTYRDLEGDTGFGSTWTQDVSTFTIGAGLRF